MNRSDTIRLAYVSNVNAWWPPGNAMAKMGVSTLAPTNVYNYFAFAFLTYSQGSMAITKLYNDPIKFLGDDLGKNKSQIQSYMIQLYQNSNVKFLASAFGDSESPVKSGIDPIQCADKFIQYALDNQLDGLDIDFEYSQSFIDGIGENWLIVFMKKLRLALPFHIISHPTQTPYFCPGFAPSGSYLKVNKQVGKFIDFYNIQFYNQGESTKYDTYQSLFIDSGKNNPNTSIYQIIAQGIEAENIVLGKPVTKADAYNTGIFQATDLNEMLKQARNDKSNPGWKASVMYWNYLSDLNGDKIGTLLKDI